MLNVPLAPVVALRRFFSPGAVTAACTIGLPVTASSTDPETVPVNVPPAGGSTRTARRGVAASTGKATTTTRARMQSRRRELGLMRLLCLDTAHNLHALAILATSEDNT